MLRRWLRVWFVGFGSGLAGVVVGAGLVVLFGFDCLVWVCVLHVIAAG